MADDRHSNFKKILDSRQPYDQFQLENISQLLKESEQNDKTLDLFQGSLVGLAIGDALGAPVEFKPNSFLQANPVKDMQSGGTWGLNEGYWTDDTSMALCLAASIIVTGKNEPLDQMRRYAKWYKKGYMSSTGKCFDIGNATRVSIEEFQHRSRASASQWDESELLRGLGPSDAAGNGCLMRIAPLALFYSRGMAKEVLKPTELSTIVTHGDQRAIDASKFFSFLVCSAVQGVEKKKLLEPNFFLENCHQTLHPDVESIIAGSYKNKNGYADGIRAKGFVLDTLEAALWAFYRDEDSFEKGVLLVVNLGDDTDTVAAVYGQLAGASYGFQKLPERWRSKLFQCDFIRAMAFHLHELHKMSQAGVRNYQQSN